MNFNWRLAWLLAGAVLGAASPCGALAQEPPKEGASGVASQALWTRAAVIRPNYEYAKVESICTVSFDSAARRLAFGWTTGHVEVWDLNRARRLAEGGGRPLGSTGTHINQVRFVCKDTRLAVASEFYTPDLWSAESCERLCQLSDDDEGHFNVSGEFPMTFACIASFSWNGRPAILGRFGRQLVAWDACSGAELTRFAEFDAAIGRSKVLGISVSQNGRTAAACLADGRVLILDLSKRALVRNVAADPSIPREATSVAVGPDGRYVTFAQGLIQTMQCDTGKRVWSMDGEGEFADAFSASPDGESIVMRHDRNDYKKSEIVQVDVATGKIIARIPTELKNIKSIVFDRDGSRIALAGDEIEIWRRTQP